MPSLEFPSSIARHANLRKLAKDLRLRPAYALGHLQSLWAAAIEQQEDGDLSKWSDATIAECADYPTNNERFVQMLQENHWMEGKLLCNWLDYAGRHLVEKYRLTDREKLVEIWKLHGQRFNEMAEVTRHKVNHHKSRIEVPDDDVIHELKLAGIVAPTVLGELRSIPGISAVGVALVSAAVTQTKGVNNPAGVVIQRLRSGWRPPATLTPQQVASIGCRIESIAGKPVHAPTVRATSNSRGVAGVAWNLAAKGDELPEKVGVPASELTIDNIKLKRA